MSSPVLASANASPSGISPGTKLSHPSGRKTIVLIVAAALCIAAGLAGLFWNRFWPFTEKAVVEDLAEASDSTVIIRGSHRTYFPFPGCILEGVEFHHGPDKWNLITIDKLTIEGSYSGILTSRVPRIRAEGGHVFVPPFGSNVTFKTQHSKLVVEELVANGAVIEFAANQPSGQPLRFEVHQGILHDVQWGNPIEYDLKFHNPEPPGEIATHGKFGVWVKGNPGETPISGEYTFDHADLGVYGGIAGMLASKGKYSGLLKHIDIAGHTDVPDFEVKTGGHKVRLVTEYTAFVDAIHGDTFLKHVEANFGRTSVAVEGSIAGIKGRKGKTALLTLTSHRGRIEDILGLFDSEARAPMSGPITAGIKGRKGKTALLTLTSHRGRIEDILGLFDSEARAPMSGPITLKAKAEIAPGKEPFLQKVKLDGDFGIGDGTFLKQETQKNVNELSAGARGEKMEDAETVLGDLKGQVVLERGIANFPDLTFSIPGAKARVHGTYNLLNHKLDLHGRMRVDTKISKTTTGAKSFLLKLIDPIFKKKKKGEVVPVHIAGTYEHPQFGLDLTDQTAQEDQKHSRK